MGPFTVQTGEIMYTVSLNTEILWVYKSIIFNENNEKEEEEEEEGGRWCRRKKKNNNNNNYKEKSLYHFLNEMKNFIGTTEICPSPKPYK